MPDIFAEETNARDRRLSETPQEEVQQEPVEEVVDKTLSHQEIQLQNFSATPSHPERHVGTKQMHIFSAYCERPEHVTFETQEDGEEILLLLRKSFITNIPWLFFSIIFILVPPFFLGIMSTGSTPYLSIPFPYAIVLLMFYYLVIASYIFVNFITWYFNTSLITNSRIVDIDFSDLVYKNIAETKMDLVQDVSFTQAGVLRTIFNYGDVLVQTAGTVDNFDLVVVPHPDRAVEIIENLIGKGRNGNV